MQNTIKKRILILSAGLLGLCAGAAAQPMTLEEVIGEARTQSVQALQARAAFVSDYWAWRSYQASRLPSLSLYGTVGGFDRSLRLLQDPKSGDLLYTSNYNMENSLGLRARQNITFTGGTLQLYTDLTRIDQFRSGGTTWYAQPVTLSYSQPLFAYNRFKWDKLISPKQYEKAKRTYLESMEDVTLRAVDRFFGVMEAQKLYDVARTNYDNTSRLLDIARERLSLGSVKRDEYLQLELRMLSDSIAVNENYVALREARMQLNSLLGLDETREVQTVLEEDLPPVLMDYDLVLRKASENSSFNLTNDINVLNADAAIAQAKAERGITMQLNARFGLSKTAPELQGVYRDLLDQEVVGLTFTVPILRQEGRGGRRGRQGPGRAGRERQAHQPLYGRGPVQQPAAAVRRVAPRRRHRPGALHPGDGQVPQRHRQRDGPQHRPHRERQRHPEVCPRHRELLELLLHAPQAHAL